MAKRTAQRKNIIKYLLFTVVTLLVTVSLLSLFVYKFANFASNNVVLGANVGPDQTSVTCGSCAQSAKGTVGIMLQQNETNPKTWGAVCATEEMLKAVRHIDYISCPTPVSVR
jgi:hypothetical protein